MKRLVSFCDRAFFNAQPQDGWNRLTLCASSMFLIELIRFAIAYGLDDGPIARTIGVLKSLPFLAIEVGFKVQRVGTDLRQSSRTWIDSGENGKPSRPARTPAATPSNHFARRAKSPGWRRSFSTTLVVPVFCPGGCALRSPVFPPATCGCREFAALILRATPLDGSCIGRRTCQAATQ
jgi:hypothetical protein